VRATQKRSRPICKTNTQANEKILKGVRGKFKSGKLDGRPPSFESLESAEKDVKQLKAILSHRDEAKLAKWLDTSKKRPTSSSRPQQT